MTYRTLTGYRHQFRCPICGTLHIAIVGIDSMYAPPIDVLEHAHQRGPKEHEIVTTIEPIFCDGGPTFAVGSRVVVNLAMEIGLEGIVLGTLVDDNGKEWVGFINRLGNPHLEDAERLMELTMSPLSSKNRYELFDPHHHQHFMIEIKGEVWLATVREFSMMWASGVSPREAMTQLIEMINEAVAYQESHPNDRGHFRK